MLISVITPNYNYEKYIGETIQSVLDQDYEYIEHIIVDDGSTDKSVKVIQHYADRYPDRVRLIRQNNSGQTKALNTALESARGDIICWINSDDTFCPGAFKKAASFFKEDESLDIVYGDYNVMDSQGRYRYRFKELKFNRFMASMIGFGVVLASNSIFWRRRCTEKVGLFDESFNFCMDDEYFSRLTRNAKMKKVNIALANWRCHPQAKTVVFHSENTLKCEEERQRLFRKYYAELPISRVLSTQYIGIPRTYVRGKMILLKIINGNYLLRLKDKIIYHQNKTLPEERNNNKI
ncbi:glycosyltransferase family 2 protein [Candidatus Contubernalis alkaliaceticus]|uniref:glycosyltransferase family 2 protein n=1 Tax=Candidatus Contubernalis alkaliaceticus TaxID=338645 RepID=UPI001F4C23C0|nr:glycosyltransferase family 2 protein [Candidatus Contubernalis alkalaceticus]UNC93609.1 glycosyltransferase [Candidatus Contubernalis alkalaceticus]